MAQDVMHIFDDPDFQDMYLEDLRGGGESFKFEGVRSVAQDHGLVGTEIKKLVLPSADNNWTAVVISRVFMKEPDGEIRVYEGVGDANEDNCNSFTKAALVRMAETRAVGRALRNALKIEGLIYEEAAESVPAETSTAKPAPESKQKTKAVVKDHRPAAAPEPESIDDDQDPSFDDLDEEFDDVDFDMDGMLEDFEPTVDDMVDEINSYLEVVSKDDVAALAKKVVGHTRLREADADVIQTLLEQVRALAEKQAG